MGRLRQIVALGALALALALVLVPAAFAAGGGAAQEGYGGQGNTQEQVSGQGAGQNLGAQSGGLPFTGLDLALLVAGGAVLIIVGATLRRAGRRNA